MDKNKIKKDIKKVSLDISQGISLDEIVYIIDYCNAILYGNTTLNKEEIFKIKEIIKFWEKYINDLDEIEYEKLKEGKND